MKKTLLVIIIMSGIMFPKSVYASDCITPPFKLTCITPLVQKGAEGLFFLSGGVAIILLILGGIQWITAGGDPKGLTKAKGTLTYAIIGLGLIMLSVAILKTLEQFLGVPLLNPNLSL